MRQDISKVTERAVQSVAAALRNAKEDARGCTLLIGAGCSASAGIPLASELIERIKEIDPDICHDEEQSGRKFTYGECMDRLGPEVRHRLLAKYIDRAK